MVSGDDAWVGILKEPLLCIFVIQEQSMVVSVYNDSPAIVSGDHMNNPVEKFEGQSVLAAEIINLLALLTVLLSNRRAAVTKPIAMLLRFLQTGKTSSVVLWDMTENAAMREMHDLSVRICTIEYSAHNEPPSGLSSTGDFFPAVMYTVTNDIS